MMPPAQNLVPVVVIMTDVVTLRAINNVSQEIVGGYGTLSGKPLTLYCMTVKQTLVHV